LFVVNNYHDYMHLCWAILPYSTSDKSRMCSTHENIVTQQCSQSPAKCQSLS